MFERLRDRLDAALAAVAHVTEHVGSTAVRGLAAKPIIDMDVVVADQTAVEPAIGRWPQPDGSMREIWATRAGRRSCRQRTPPIIICTWSWREAGRIAITSTFVTS